MCKVVRMKCLTVPYNCLVLSRAFGYFWRTSPQCQTLKQRLPSQPAVQQAHPLDRLGWRHQLSGSGTYTDPMGNQCRNLVDYQIPEDAVVVRSYSYYQLIRMHMMRTCIGLYIVGLLVLAFCLLVGVRGCWRRNLSLIMMTGIMLLFATLLMIAAVAVWHGVDYIERELIDRKPFYKTWPSILRRSTDISYGWSYMIAWIGISFILISSVLMLVAHRKMKEEEQREMDSKTVPYIIPSYHEKIMMMPYTHNYYGGYPQQMYGSYGVAPPMTNSYYGYLNYGH